MTKPGILSILSITVLLTACGGDNSNSSESSLFPSPSVSISPDPNITVSPTPTVTPATTAIPTTTVSPLPTSTATPTSTPTLIGTITPVPTVTTTPTPSPQLPDETGNKPRYTDLRNYIFGHSLIVHTPPKYPTPSDETTVPHWLHFLAQASGFTYKVDGQYGFLMQHSVMPPRPQWGFKDVEGIWGENGDFPSSDYNAVLLTAANFIQYQPATQPYDGDNPTNTTPVNETLKIIDWVSTSEPGISIYIYENWPDMASYVDDGEDFNPTKEQFAAYNAYTLSSFHTWWLDYHDEVVAQRPNANVKMIPVGPILSNLLTNTVLSEIPITDLYEDNAPHGKPTLYFLASLITYMSMYEVQPAANFEIPEDTVHATVRNNYTMIVNYIWKELQNFNFDSGQSRVW